MEHTHLVQGLDIQLLAQQRERIRREKEAQAMAQGFREGLHGQRAAVDLITPGAEVGDDDLEAVYLSARQKSRSQSTRSTVRAVEFDPDRLRATGKVPSVEEQLSSVKFETGFGRTVFRAFAELLVTQARESEIMDPSKPIRGNFKSRRPEQSANVISIEILSFLLFFCCLPDCLMMIASQNLRDFDVLFFLFLFFLSNSSVSLPSFLEILRFHVFRLSSFGFL